ncbi:MAG: ABC transporter substrate-binding protein [Chloroflexi bacterium]|nr:ABC transporter substrate-binding protein [Chloroflexota bacterium]
MKYFKVASVILVVLALLASPLLACGGKQTTGTVTIPVGYMTDLTGAASSAMQPNQWAILDCWAYLEKTDPIPGAKLKLVAYDTALDSAKFIPGYEWLKTQGIVVLYSYMPQITDTLFQFIVNDKMPLITNTVGPAAAACPWLFQSGMSVANQYDLALQWLSDKWPNYPTKPKIGAVGWDTSYEKDIIAAIKPYCLARPDKYEWVGSYLAPIGTMSWGGEVSALKGCDYICPCHAGGTGYSTFISQFRDAGGKATFFCGEGMPCWTNLILPTVGWAGMDKSFDALSWPWVTYQNAPSLVAACNAAIQARQGQTRFSLGYGYVSQFFAQVLEYQLLKATVERVGAANVDGQAVYDTAIAFSYTIEGIPTMTWTATNRVNTHSGMIYEWNAQAGDLVPISDWLVAPTS